MHYAIRAKAVTYKGIVFRSKLEARCYDYLINKMPAIDGYHIEYEPKLIRTHNWNPDFAIYQHEELVQLIEVKPDTLMFDVMTYIINCLQIENIPYATTMCGAYMIRFTPDGGFKIFPHDPVLWAQTFNNVNHGT